MLERGIMMSKNEKLKKIETLIEKIINNTNETNICINNKDKKHLIQALKKLEVELTLRDKKAKGEIRTNTFIIIYLSEYEKVKFKKPIEIMLFNRPSIEKIVKLFSSICIIILSLSTKVEKLIVEPNKLFPNSRIAEEIELVINISCSQINIEEFIQIQKINNLKIKLTGRSVWVIKRFDNNNLKQ